VFDKQQVCDVFFVYGAANTGKSTFANFAINKLLNTYDFVYLIEADVGQPTILLPG